MSMVRAIVLSAIMVASAFSAAFGKDVESVAVAASIYPCVSDMAARFEKETGMKAPELITGSSGKLAAQIQAGAPFGLYLSANRRWAERLQEQGFLEDLRPMASSPLVIWWDRKDVPPVGNEINSFCVSIADPVAAPFGKAAKEYLVSLGLYDSMMSDRMIVIAGSVLQTALVADSGGSDAAIVSLSIAVKMGKGRYEILPVSPLENAGGLIKERSGETCKAFWDFIRSGDMIPVWKRWGFKPVEM